MLRISPMLPALLITAIPVLQAQADEDGRLLYRFRMNHLQQNVGLTEDQARAVVERWARYDRELFEKTRQIRQIRNRFEDILLGPGTEEEKSARVAPLLDQFVALRHEQVNLKMQFEQDIRARLSPAQQVRLILQVDELQRRLAEAIRGGLGGRGLRNRPGFQRREDR